MNAIAPKVSVVVVHRNGRDFLRDCLFSLSQTDYPKDLLEILCVDNGSTDGSQDLVREEFPHAQLIENSPNNYAAANNKGIRQAEGDYVVLMNNDAKADPGWLWPLVRAMEQNPSLGGVQPKLLFFDGSLQSLGHVRHPDFYWMDRGMGEPDFGQYGEGLLDADSLCGACALYRRACLDQAGLLDEDFVMYLEDVDLSLRCQAKGWKLACQPKSVVFHYGHGSVGSEDKARAMSESNRLMLIAKHWPEKLAENLMGRGFFLGPGKEAREAFIPAVSRACDKMTAVHGKRTLRKALQEVFAKLEKFLDPPRDVLVKDAFARLDAMARRLESAELSVRDVESRLYGEIDRLRDLALQREEELRLLRESLSYRYVLRPAQQAADRVKAAFPVVRKAPALPSPALPQIVSMKFTNNCQLKCRMCGIWTQPQEEELSTGQWRDAMDKVFEWLGPYRLDIAGGEPLLRSDNDALVAHAAAMGVETVLLSNAGLITKARARKLLDSGLDSIHISLDSLKPATHDHLRGVPGTFASAMRAIRHLKELRRYRAKEFGIGVATIVMAPNAGELTGLAEFVRQGGADFISFQPLDQNFHTKHDPRWFISNPFWIRDMDALGRSLDQLGAMKLRGFPIDNSLGQLQAMKRYFMDPEAFCRSAPCLSGDKNFIVKNNGDALLCWNLPPVGNILHDAPGRIWNSTEAKKRREQIAQCGRTCRILSCHCKEEALSER